MQILKKISFKHPNLASFNTVEQHQKDHRFCMLSLSEEELPIEDYLQRNQHVISLSTRFSLMAQICSFMQFLHKRSIGYFIELSNISVTKKCIVKIRNFRNAYSQDNWNDQKTKEEKKFTKIPCIIAGKDRRVFPWVNF